VIHFNHGIHDVKIMPDGKRQVEPADYEANLRTIVAKLKATGAKLIFATSTPIPPSPLIGNRNFGSEKEYNAIATRVMTENGVTVNDLHSYMLPRFEELHNPNDLHYKPEGSEFLAKRVAEVIAAALTQ
jgi:acyl-CoA thioesterase-1